MTNAQNIAATLESLVDATSLHQVLAELGTIAYEKHEHIKANWQDPITARPWRIAARKLESLASETDI